MQSSLLIAREVIGRIERIQISDMIIKSLPKAITILKFQLENRERSYQHTLLHRDDSTIYFKLKLLNHEG